MFISLLFVRTFENFSRHPNQISIVIATQSFAEVGIQIIAVSQACSSLELDLHLQDVKAGKSRDTSALTNPGVHNRDIDKRKRFLTLFLIVHIVVLVCIPAIMWIAEARVLVKYNP